MIVNAVWHHEPDAREQYIDPRRGLRRLHAGRPVPPQRHHLHPSWSSVFRLRWTDAGGIHGRLLQSTHSQQIPVSRHSQNITQIMSKTMTPKQIEANRRNARKSTEPTTPAGP